MMKAALLSVLVLVSAQDPKANAPYEDASTLYKTAQKAAKKWSASAYLVQVTVGRIGKNIKGAGRTREASFLFNTKENCRTGIVDVLQVHVYTYADWRASKDGKFYARTEHQAHWNRTPAMAPVGDKWIGSASAAKVFFNNALKGAQDSEELVLQSKLGKSMWLAGRSPRFFAVDAGNRKYYGAVQENSDDSMRDYFKKNLPTIGIPEAYARAQKFLETWGDPGEIGFKGLSAKNIDYRDYMKTGRVNTVTFYVYVSKPEIRTMQLQVYGDVVYALSGSPVDAAAFRSCEGDPAWYDGDRIRKAVEQRSTYKQWAKVNKKGTLGIGSANQDAYAPYLYFKSDRGKLAGVYDPQKDTFPDWVEQENKDK